MIGNDRTVRQASQRGKLLGQRRGTGLEMHAAELELRRRQLYLQKRVKGIDPGFGALFLDGDETSCISLLLSHSLEFVLDSIHLNVVGGGVKGDLLLCVLETQVGGFHAGPRGLGVLALREAENEGLHRCVTNRGLAGRKAVRVADLGTNDEVGDIGVFSLGESGLGL